MDQIDKDTHEVLALKEKASAPAVKTSKKKKKKQAAMIEYVCMTDCWNSKAKRYYKRGHVLVLEDGQKCPPHFKRLDQ